MRQPLFVRPLTDSEREQMQAGLRSSDAFVLRRCQVVLASVRRQTAPRIALNLGCDDETVRDIIRAFNERGLDIRTRRSCRPHKIEAAFSPERAEKLRNLLHQSPRNFGKQTSLWTLALAAEISCEQGLTAELVSDETIRATLTRLGVRWKRAKQWITSPDPEYGRKKGLEIA